MRGCVVGSAVGVNGSSSWAARRLGWDLGAEPHHYHH
jgi:hypothetical protein